MAKGGYHILDMKNKPIVISPNGEITPTKIDGIYDSIEGSYRKAQLLSNLVLVKDGDAIECFDRFVVFGLNGGEYISQISIDGNINLLRMTITAEDMVYVELN